MINNIYTGLVLDAVIDEIIDRYASQYDKTFEFINLSDIVILILAWFVIPRFIGFHETSRGILYGRVRKVAGNGIAWLLGKIKA